MRLPGSPWLSRASAWLLPLSMLACIVPTAETALLERVEPDLHLRLVPGLGLHEEGAGESARRLLETVAVLSARAAADVPSPPPQVIVPDLPAPYIPPPCNPPPPPPRTF